MAEETSVSYSEKYYDDIYEYRHVRLPAHIAEVVPRNHLMTESEWRNLGIQQSPFWEHYMLHTPEPHILLYRRLKEIALNEQAQAQNTSNE